MQQEGVIFLGESYLPARFKELRDWYRRVFSIQEIENDVILKWFTGAILLGFFVTFNSWMYFEDTTIKAVENSAFVCWPLFQNCQSLIWMSTLPEGYSQMIFFMLLFGIMVLIIYCMQQNMWTFVHFAIGILFISKLYFMIIAHSHKGNYDYYHNTFCILYLLAAHKVFFLRFSLVFFYFLSTASKIYPSWILGEYFTSLKTGLPIFPFGSEVIMTNIVIIMEMIFSWFLFSNNKTLQRSVLIFFIIFHLYSGILVGYRYPSTVLPALIILFGPWFRAVSPPAGLNSTFGWIVVTFLTIAQLIPHLMPGDEKLTLEGNYFGLYMFEANHQCFATISKDGKVLRSLRTANARMRCNPYDMWFQAKHKYCSTDGGPIAMQYTHSVNGRAFREIVNEPDICQLEYKAFGRNAWIKDESTAPSIGIPVQSIYR